MVNLTSSTPQTTEKTLVVLAVDQQVVKKIHLRKVARLDSSLIWFFYRGDFHYWIDAEGSLQAKLLAVPEYSRSMAEFVINSVTLEVARNPVYSRILIVTDNPGQYHTGLEFLRQNGITAEVAGLSAQGPDLVPGAPGAAPEGNLDTSSSGGAGAVGGFTPPPRKRKRRKMKLPADRDTLVTVMNALLSELTPGEIRKKTELSPIIHKRTGSNVRDLFKQNNLTAFVRYLVNQDIIQILEDGKHFQVLRTDWELNHDDVRDV